MRKVLAGRKSLHEVQSDFRSRGPLATQRTESASMGVHMDRSRVGFKANSGDSERMIDNSYE